MPKDEARAAGLFAQACQGGHPLSCRNVLGLEAQAGHPEKAAEALHRLEKACQDGEAAACHQLGSIYDHGVGVTADRVRAGGYYRKACTGGEEESCARVR